jgi:hypothetical protein
MVPEMIRRTDSGKHQQLWRRDGAGAQDDLPPLVAKTFSSSPTLTFVYGKDFHSRGLGPILSNFLQS